MQIEMLNKILYPKSEQFHILEHIFDVNQYQIRPTAHWNEVKKMVQCDYNEIHVDRNY